MFEGISAKTLCYCGLSILATFKLVDPGPELMLALKLFLLFRRNLLTLRRFAALSGNVLIIQLVSLPVSDILKQHGNSKQKLWKRTLQIRADGKNTKTEKLIFFPLKNHPH